MDQYCCKVNRAIHKYEIGPPDHFSGDTDAYLSYKWRGAGAQDPVGYRQLAEWLNKRMLKSVYKASGRPDFDSRIDAEYEVLWDDTVADHDREELLADLVADGIDGEELVSDFISKSTMSRHIRNCLDISTDQKERAERSNWERDQIDIAQERLRNKVETSLQSLENKNRLARASSANISISIQLSCPECPTRVTISEALERGYICEHLDSNS